MKIEQCLILAAGFGSRLNPITKKIPKPLLPLGEMKLIDNSISIAQEFSLEPIVATGYLNEEIKKHLESKKIRYFEIKSPSSNLLESIALAKNHIKSENFMWMGSAMFFKDHSEIRTIIKSHFQTLAFCSLFYQDRVKYTPKLIIENNRLTKFIVGDFETQFSSPTLFIVNSDFINFCERYSEKDVFQKIIDKGFKINLIKLNDESKEIHDLNDYKQIMQQSLPTGFICKSSKLLNSKTIKSFIYNSIIQDSEIYNTVIIDSEISGLKIENSFVFENKIVM